MPELDEDDAELLAAYQAHVDPAGTLEQARAAFVDCTFDLEVWAERRGGEGWRPEHWLEREGLVAVPRGRRESWVFQAH